MNEWIWIIWTLMFLQSLNFSTFSFMVVLFTGNLMRQWCPFNIVSLDCFCNILLHFNSIPFRFYTTFLASSWDKSFQKNILYLPDKRQLKVRHKCFVSHHYQSPLGCLNSWNVKIQGRDVASNHPPEMWTLSPPPIYTFTPLLCGKWLFTWIRGLDLISIQWR